MIKYNEMCVCVLAWGNILFNCGVIMCGMIALVGLSKSLFYVGGWM